jgi:anti-sigma-K factor RskA
VNPPADHPRADEAIEWLLELDNPERHARFSRELESDSSLRRLTNELREILALVSLDVPQHAAPPQSRKRILDAATAQLQAGSAAQVVLRPQSFSWREPLAWAAAVMLAGGCLWMATERSGLLGHIARLEARASDLDRQVQASKNATLLANMEIGTLQATLEEYRQGVAVVIWDESKQEGVLKLEKMPPLSAEKDYQLWVVDPSHANPVNAGVVRVSDTGFARVQFKPDALIQKAEKFALSVEKHGGVAVHEGPIVLLSP